MARNDSETLAYFARLTAEHRQPRPAARSERMPKWLAKTFSTGPGSGGFEGARRDRTTGDWLPGSIGPNRLHMQNGTLLRERARDLVLNNPKAKSAVGAYIANCIEGGITPKPKFADAEQRRLWLDGWDTWGGLTALNDSQADITEFDTIYGLQGLWLSEVLIAGGCLTHYVEVERTAERRLPLAIELIPEERFAEDRDSYVGVNRKTTDIQRGVEIDPATGKHLAYWVKRHDPNDLTVDLEQPLRIPRNQCKYAFFRGRIGQHRGHTLLHAAIIWLWRLGYYVDNELLASQLKSSWAYAIDAGEDGADVELFQDTDAAVIDAAGNDIDRVEQGMILQARKGKIEAIGPNVPGGDSIPWIKLIEQSIAAGVDLSEVELTRDYSRTSFSSARSAHNADRKRYTRVQKFTISHFCMPTWRRFAKAAARAGLDGFPSPARFVSEIDSWLKVSWRPPGWASVNPLDDARANDIRLKNRTKTREAIMAAEGDDWEDGFEQMDREEQRLDDLELTSSTQQQPASTTAPVQPDSAAIDNLPSESMLDALSHGGFRDE